MSNKGQQAPIAGTHAGFEPTDWKTVIDASGESSAAAVPALKRLCETYWYPLYAHVRRCGHGSHDAEDLTQGFFAFLLGSDGLKTVQPAKGRFRSFLLASINHFLSNERDHQNAIKRGGKTVILSWDTVEAEQRFAHEPVDSASPDVLFDRNWAKALVESVSARLRSEYKVRRQEQTFVALEKYLTRDVDRGEYAVIALELGMTEGAVRTSVTRLRDRFGKLIRAELAQTISDPTELNDELHHIIEALRHE
jgi:RNA polymerase sigma-70 factor (ECF subfamily)